MCKVISILNMKGGVGKTTTSINLSKGLSNKGYKVLHIDFDPQANSSDYFIHENKSYTFIDQMLMHGNAIAYAINENLSFIPSRLDLALTEREILLDTRAQHNRLYKVIKALKTDYDFVIIDCPPILNLLTVNALNASDEIIIPIKIDKGAEKGFHITIENIAAIAESYDLELEYKVLFTMVNRNNTDRARMEAINETCKEHAIHTTIRNQPKPITDSGYKQHPAIDGSSNVAKDYQQLVEELIFTWTPCPCKK